MRSFDSTNHEMKYVLLDSFTDMLTVTHHTHAHFTQTCLRLHVVGGGHCLLLGGFLGGGRRGVREEGQKKRGERGGVREEGERRKRSAK